MKEVFAKTILILFHNQWEMQSRQNRTFKGKMELASTIGSTGKIK